MKHESANHYIPILKGKLGELDALRYAKAEMRDLFTPFLEIPPIPPKWVTGKEEPIPSKTIDKHISSVTESFTKRLEGYSYVFLDGILVQDDLPADPTQEAMTVLATSLLNSGVRVIPVAGIDRVEEYNDSVKAVVSAHSIGCCIRVTESDLEDMMVTPGQLESLLAYLELPPSAIDIVLDFGPKVPSRAALPLQIRSFPLLREWRSFTVASSSFPVDLRSIPPGRLTLLQREEWDVWSFLRSKQNLSTRSVAFGDYAIAHPLISEVDPRIMNQSPNIRYTTDSGYLVAKGVGVRRRRPAKNVPPAEQLPGLAKDIVKHTEWKGEEFSWGDQFIAACAREERIGNPTNWRSVGNSHHIAVVVHQLASLPEPE